MLPMPGDDVEGLNGDFGIDMAGYEVMGCTASWEAACTFRVYLMPSRSIRNSIKSLKLDRIAGGPV